MTIDRRNFLLGSGALALLASSAGLLSPVAEAAATTPLRITGGDQRLFGPSKLDYRSGFQSFAWSPVLKAFVYAQPSLRSNVKGGTTEAKHRGDLLLSTITASGKITKSHMQLNGFGHGGAMGVEISGSHTYVWLDCDAYVPKDGDADARAICCFRYTGKGGPYNPKLLLKTPHAQHYDLKPGSTHNAVTYDASTRRIALRYRTGTTDRYAVYNVAELRRTGNRTKPVYDAIAAGTAEAGGTGSRQSFALYGDWLYAIRGSKGKDNATLHAYNLNTRTATHAPLHAAAGAKGREPEGLCVYPTAKGPRLAYGIKTDVASPNQRSSVYYKP